MKSKNSFSGVPWFFTIIWTVITLGFDIGFGCMAYWNVQSYWYAETEGTITLSQLKTSRDSDGDASYRPEIEYDYVIGGQTLHGKNRRFGEMGVGGTNVRKSVQQVLDRYPVGAKAAVYYDPNHSDWSVLERGVSGSDLFIAMFMTPFNLVMLALWVGSLRKPATDEEGLLKGLITETARGWEIRERTSVLGPFLVGVGAASFVMIFVVAFGIGFYPSLTAMAVVWSIVGLLGITTIIVVAGAPFGALIDDVSGDVTLRGWFGGSKASLSRSQIQNVRCERKSGDSDTPDSYDVEVSYNDDIGNPQTTSIYTSQQPERPQALAKWMREKLRLENDAEQSVDEEPSET